MKVMHWNVLSSRYAMDDFPQVPNRLEVLPWEFRLPRILCAIFNEHPDLICLVEVDHPTELALGNQGYAHLFVRKGSADSTDGTMIQWRRDALQMVGVRNIDLGGSQRGVLCHFQHRTGSCPSFVLVATHLKAKRGFEAKRAEQAETLMAAADAFREETGVRHLLVTGDMNDEPDSGALAVFARRGLLPVHDTGPGAFTTCKWRPETGLVKHTIDYILADPTEFGATHAECVGMKHVPACGLPSTDTPSDHLPLTATLEFK